MCEPTTIAIIGLAVAAGGTMYAASQQQDAMNRQAEVASMNADQVRGQTEMQVAELQRRAAVIAGQQNAMYGASGVDVSSGSPITTAGATAAGEKLDEYNTRSAGAYQAWNLAASASNYKAQANSAMTGALANFAVRTASRGYGGGLGGGGMSTSDYLGSVSSSPSGVASQGITWNASPYSSTGFLDSQ